MSDTLPPIVVSRQARALGHGLSEARSWFGSLPRLGGLPWPRGRNSGKPLVFAAQIDLADLANVKSHLPLPFEGSLAFFLDEGAIVYVPAGASRTPTAPPAGAAPAFEPCGDIFPQNPSPWARRSFPYWPVEFTVLEVGPVEPDGEDDGPGDNMRAAMAAALARRFERRQYFFSAKQALEMLGEGSALYWWHGAHAYVEHLKIARFHAGDVERARRPYLEKARAEVDRLTPKRQLGVFGRRRAEPDEALAQALKTLQEREAQAAEYRRQMSGIDAFIAEAEAFAAGRNPWTRMLAGEIESFKALFDRGRAEFEDLVRYRTPHSIDDIATGTLLAMATGDDVAFRAMPLPIRDLINARYLLPTQSWHQMFGPGVDIQGNAVAENEGNHLLLQLVYDDMVAWNFGDMGAFQFWISPDDLEAGHWSRATLTFECH